jgi:hypothetical protein
MNRELLVTKSYIGRSSGTRNSAPCSYFALSTELQQNIRTYGQQHSSVYDDVTSETDIRRTQVNGSQEGVNLKRNNVLNFLFT